MVDLINKANTGYLMRLGDYSVASMHDHQCGCYQHHVVGVVVPDVLISDVVSCGGSGGGCGGGGSGSSGAAMAAVAKLFLSLFDCLLFMSFIMKLFSHRQSVCACVMQHTCMNAHAYS